MNVLEKIKSWERTMGAVGAELVAYGDPSHGSRQVAGRIENLSFSVSPTFRNDFSRQSLVQTLLVPEVVSIGNASELHLRSSLSPFKMLPEYGVSYPAAVITALGELFSEYNEAFRPLVKSNQEGMSDYQYAIGEGRIPLNRFVQIDMTGMPQSFLEQAKKVDRSTLKEVLRQCIFEIENSMAMYQFLGRAFAINGDQSRFDGELRTALDAIREQYKMPIALLAGTEDKYSAMMATEFGCCEGKIGSGLVKELSGFDRCFSPLEFKEYLTENEGKCDYLLYARTSEPIRKLRDPKVTVENPLLSDNRLRRIIKEHSLTFNIDNPEWQPADPRRINDTKAYMPAMGMGIIAESTAVLGTDEFQRYLGKASLGQEVSIVRGKPAIASYGCYGHFRESLQGVRLAKLLQREINQRGPYVLQPEKPVPTLRDGSAEFAYIDRNFFALRGSEVRFMGGVRALLPVNSDEVRRGRLHGNKDAHWAEIRPE